MRRVPTLASLLVMFVIPAVASCDAPPPATSKSPASNAAKRDGWPETPAGAMGRGWVQAFASGDSAMRDFYVRSMDPDSLARRSADQRLGRYRTMREQYGKLVLGSVMKSTPTVLDVTLLDAEAKGHEFIFTVQKDPPHKLVSVGMKQRTHGFGGFHH